MTASPHSSPLAGSVSRAAAALPSAAERQRSCAGCGRRFQAGERTGLEAFLDGEVRYAAVHIECSTFPAARETIIAARLHRLDGPAAA